MMDLPFDVVVSGLVWYVLSRVGIVLIDLLLINQLSRAVVELACKMTPNSSLSFPYCMYLETVLFVPDLHIHVYCCECVMHVPR